jgi:hypothetical protein
MIEIIQDFPGKASKLYSSQVYFLGIAGSTGGHELQELFF